MKQVILTHIPLIYELRHNGHSFKEIAAIFADEFELTECNEFQIRDIVKNIQNSTINKRYNDFIVIDGMKSFSDKTLDEYAVDFHGLLVTNKMASRYMQNREFIVTEKSITTISDNEAMLYAKRLLKLYHLPDAELLKQHALLRRNAIPIDYQTIISQLHETFDAEVTQLIVDIKLKHKNYLISQFKGALNGNN